MKHDPIFVCWPSDSPLFPYCIARLDPKTSGYIPLVGQLFSTREEANAVAREMNEEWLKESNIE